MSITVQVTGVGSSNTVEINEDAKVSDALIEAGIDTAAQGLTLKRDGAPVDADAPLNDGDQVLATPRSAKLGS
jgi:sulfur carrier protein ThiS